MTGVCKGGILRWAVNTTSWNPSRIEWVTAMRLVGNDEERSRINRFVFKKHAKHAIVGRLLIRQCCNDFLGIGRFTFSDEHQSDQLTIKRSEKGKPILIQKDIDGNEVIFDQFQFNISHSGDYCVLAADSNTTELGVDIMKVEYSGGINRINDFFRIMHRQFSLEEWKYINQLETNQSRLERFIRLWSLKESLVKAQGSGIVFPLSKISFTCPSELTSPEQQMRFDSVASINGQRLEDWFFEESMIDNMHYVSVAKCNKSTTNLNSSTMTDLSSLQYRFKFLSIEDLLKDNSINNKDLFTYDDEKYWTDFCQKS